MMEPVLYVELLRQIFSQIPRTRSLGFAPELPGFFPECMDLKDLLMEEVKP